MNNSSAAHTVKDSRSSEESKQTPAVLGSRGEKPAAAISPDASQCDSEGATGSASQSSAATTKSRRVAALFVDPKGVYASLPDVELWDEARDARLYDGPWSVVAHPPCGRWSRLAGLVEHRWGHRAGEDGGCFAAALRAVRSYGGVLEHPAFSRAWDAFGLPEPLAREGWTAGMCGGWSCYVEQGSYGLSVAKPTWLYAFGVTLPDLRWGGSWHERYEPGYVARTTKSVQGWTRRGGGEGPLGRSSSTPTEFRDALLGMARTVELIFDAR